MQDTEQKNEEGGEYIGMSKVFGLQREDYTTPSGGEVVKVLFEGAAPKIMSMRTYKLLATPHPVDATALQNKQFDFLLNDMVALFLEYSPTSLQIDVFINQMLVPRLQSIFAKAAFLSVSQKSTGDSKLREWVPGTADFSQYVTLLECDMIANKFVEEENAKLSNNKKDGDK